MMPERRVLRTPRRRPTFWLLFLLVAASLAISLAAGAQNPDGYLRVANPGNPASLDPHKITGVWENRIVGDMFMGLTTEAADGRVVPGAAESWQVSADGLTWDFKIRSHQWSDGRPVTAQDFVYSFRRMLAPETACLYADFFFVIEGARDYTGGKSGPAGLAVSAPSDDHLRIVLRRPVAYFPGLLMHFAAMPVPGHVIDKLGADWTAPEHIVVNGAFTLQARIPNERVTLRKNPRFFGAGEVRLPGVIYYSQENRDAAVQRYRAGGLDVLRDFPAGKAAWLAEQFGAAVRTPPYLGLTYVVINHRQAALSDVRVREALSLGLERRIIAERILGSGEQPAYSLVPPDTGNYGDPARFAYADAPRDERIARARRLMAAAGFSASQPLELELRLRTSENDRRVAIAAQSMWRDAFFAVELLRAETAIHYATLQAGEFDLGLASWLAVYDDPQTFTLLAQTGAGANNLGGFADARYDELTGQAARTLDLDARARLLRAAEQIALEKHALLPLFHHAARNVVSPAVGGWQSNNLDMHRSRYLLFR